MNYIRTFQERLEALINTGVHINFQASQHKYKITPLMIAASRGLLEVVRLLIQKGAKIDQLGIWFISFFPDLDGSFLSIFKFYLEIVYL